jgi:heavy metal efflux system protein
MKGACLLAIFEEIQVVTEASIIARRENQRQISVRTNIHSRDQADLLLKHSNASPIKVKLPPGSSVQ